MPQSPSPRSLFAAPTHGLRGALAALALCAAAAPGCHGGKGRAQEAARAAPTAGATAHTTAAEPAKPAEVASPVAADSAPAAPATGDVVSSEGYRDWGKNPWIEAARDSLSTFAADVDTASFTIARRKLTEAQLPPPAAVRVEEFVNFFRYDVPAPVDGAFSVVAEAAPSPLIPGRHVLRVSVATRPKAASERTPMNLVFLVDTSGSMSSDDKLGLAKRALRILVDNLKEGDTVALTTYAGSSEVVLPATSAGERERILAAIDSLGAGGSTAMGSGISLAYREAAKNRRAGALSRVIVLSDGDANVGPTSHAEILELITEHAHQGISLSTIGFGMGNYKDETMEQLADKGDGNNFYIDNVDEARRVFQDELGSTLELVAKDVKLQIELDPKLVARYRLLGYENRDVADRDFRNDQVDAGEVGAGHQVTAMYELELTDAGKRALASLATVRVRYRSPLPEQASEPAVERAFPMAPEVLAPAFARASADFRFAFAVAAFADVLRGSEDSEHWSLAQVRALASAAAGAAPERRELVGLIDRAIALRAGSANATAELAR